MIYSNNFCCFSSISRSFFSCHFTYSLICFSFNPTVLTQYPRLHKCRPQYRLPNLSYLWNNLIANFPFKYPITDDTAYFGGMDITKWIWSSLTFNSSISTNSFCRHNWYICPLTYSPISSLNIQYRYFGQQTTWYLHSYSVCDNFLNCLLIMYLLTGFWYLPGPWRYIMKIPKPVKPFYGTTTRGSGLNRLINILAPLLPMPPPLLGALGTPPISPIAFLAFVVWRCFSLPPLTTFVKNHLLVLLFPGLP